MKGSIRIVYFGTPQFSAEVLRYLKSQSVFVVGIVTQPDRPRGRSIKQQPSPVKQVAEECFLTTPLLQPEKASNEVFLEELRALQADLFVVVAFGQILTEKLLSIPSKGCINVHTSLLPKYRGAAPIQRCLLAGEKETGVSIQKMVKALDAGDVIATAKMQIPREMIFKELEAALCELSKPLLLKVIETYSVGIPNAKPQDHTRVTYAAKITPEEGEIRWSDPAGKIHNQIRGFSPRPGAWCWIEKPVKKMKILASREVDLQEGAPGEILSNEGIIACGEGALQILTVQPEGKKAMSWSDWYRGSLKFSHFN